jgi:hypothetical protein
MLGPEEDRETDALRVVEHVDGVSQARVDRRRIGDEANPPSGDRHAIKLVVQDALQADDYPLRA